MTSTPMCLCFLFEGDLQSPRAVLLGRKKLGLGAGNIVGLGGHIDPGETALVATCREVAEESGLIVQETDLEHRGELRFAFPAKPEWDQVVAVFVANKWQGTPVDSGEISPEWHPTDELPLDEMWDDARYWLPQVMAGAHVWADIVFMDDNRTVAQVQFDDPAQGLRGGRQRVGFAQ